MKPVIIGIALLLLATSVQAADLPIKAVEHGRKYLDVRELTGNNDAPEIDKFLKYLGLPKGLSWCAAYSLYCYKEAADELRIKQPFPRYGRVAMLWSTCQRNPLKYRAITSDEVRLGSVQLQAGDLPVWSHGTIKAGDFNGHTGMVLRQLSPRSFQSIEGNTSSGNKGSQREGNGVFIREREIAPGSFRILGFCRAQ
jgi:hypothetical protein